MKSNDTIILGAGMTGLAAGWASGLPVYEATDRPGGICSSYYMRPGHEERLTSLPDDEEVYHFEVGGGHWIFGGDPSVHRLLESLVDVRTYERNSAAYFPGRDLLVPYPMQNNLRFFEDDLAAQALQEMARGDNSAEEVETMSAWMEKYFGPTLCELFFHPFHELYTAGLWKEIAPQDKYKSPVSLPLAIEGAFDDTPAVGYNANFVYPRKGLDALSRRLAAGTDVKYGKRAVDIAPDRKTVHFSDGSSERYDTLISTLPLNKMVEMTDTDVEDRAYPSPSVLVVNVGAKKGPDCPDEQWLYIPESGPDFHRVGFYSNVDNHFLPSSVRGTDDYVSIYVEKAYPEGVEFGDIDTDTLGQDIVEELQEWGWIEEAEVVDPTWIDVAYTWAWPNSDWKQLSLDRLEEQDIIQVGRYARWVFQGIADSIEDGLFTGAAFREPESERVQQILADGQ